MLPLTWNIKYPMKFLKSSNYYFTSQKWTQIFSYPLENEEAKSCLLKCDTQWTIFGLFCALIKLEIIYFKLAVLPGIARETIFLYIQAKPRANASFSFPENLSDYYEHLKKMPNQSSRSQAMCLPTNSILFLYIWEKACERTISDNPWRSIRKWRVYANRQNTCRFQTLQSILQTIFYYLYIPLLSWYHKLSKITKI